MKFISLFSGIGGFDLGFERAGMECVTQVEFDVKARGVLATHWPTVKQLEDVRHVGKSNLSTVDVICGGFPCQDVSVAGRRAGLAGERSGLWFEFIRIIAELTPRWVVIENVPGLLTSNQGRDFAVILSGLVERGYGVCWRVLDSQHFGLAQRRKRVFIVAGLTAAGCNPAKVLFESESGGGRDNAGESQGETPTACVIKGAAIGRQPENGPQYGEISEDGTCYTLNTSEVHAVACALPASGAGTSRTGNERTEASFLVPMAFGLATSVTPKFAEELSPTLMIPSQSGGGQPMAVATFQPLAFTWHTANRMSIEIDKTPTMTVSDHTPLAGQPTAYAVRRLTPIEAERLQGFPDNWTAVNEQSDSARYKQLGNAVSVPVAEWIGRRLMGVNRSKV